MRPISISARRSAIPAGAIALSLALSGISGSVGAQSTEELARKKALEFVEDALPGFLELDYQESDAHEGSIGLKYDWSSDNDWVDDFGPNGTDFSGTSSSFFAKGSYLFDDAATNPADLSELGAKWSRRWFPISVGNPLTGDAPARVQQCVLESENPDTTSEDCRVRLGYGATQMSYWYVNADVHLKVEGDQSFDQRHYVYGGELNLSRSLGEQTLIINPVLTLGLEQVDPKDDKARLAVQPQEEEYSRFYGKLAFTGVLVRINDLPIKLSVALRYFKELNADAGIRNAGLDSFTYRAVALQIPAALVPGFDNTRNSFVLSYGDGSLPFNRQDEQLIELGFRHDIDFSELF